MTAEELVLSIWDRATRHKLIDYSDWLSVKQTDFLRRLVMEVQHREPRTCDRDGRKYWGYVYDGDRLLAAWDMAVSPINGCGLLKVSVARAYETVSHIHKVDGRTVCVTCLADLVIEHGRSGKNGMDLSGGGWTVVTEAPVCERCGSKLPVEQREKDV